MPRYPDERCEAAVAKMLPPYNLSPREVAEQEGISTATVYKWRKEARAQGRCLPQGSQDGSEAWTSRDKFAAVVETAGMNAQEVAEYCRARGLYPEQLKAWRQDCEQAAGLAAQDRRREARELKDHKARVRTLEQELRRKEAALADTAALLTLSKKVRAIWGDEEK